MASTSCSTLAAPGMPKCSPPTCSTARHTDRYRCRQPGAVMHHLTVSTASNAQQISSVPRGKSLTASAKERARFLGRREANRTSLAPSRPTWPTGQAWYHMPTARVASRTSLVPPTSRSNNTNLEFKVRPQDKPGTTKEAQRHRCCLNKWPAGQAWYHRVARSNKTNHELKSDQQAKPGTTKKTT